MMLFAVVIGVLIVFYVYTYIKQKKRRRKHDDAVSRFKRTYQKNQLQKKTEDIEGYTKYLTKYNSPVDYVEKEEFLKEAAEPDEKNQPEKKRLQF